jgi:ATP-dependent exoDNAse (exonuclease V) beta subunit
VQKSILHNYGRFAVLTIDKFFQKVLQAFVREAGLYPGFDIELDTRRLVEETVDIVLENATADAHRSSWIWQFVERNIEDSRTWNIKDALIKLGGELFGEKYQQLDSTLHTLLNDKEFLTNYYAQRESEMSQVDAAMRSIGRKARDIMYKNGYVADDFPYKKAGFINYFEKIAVGIYEIGVRTAAAVDDIAKWSTKGKDNSEAYNMLNPLLCKACDLWQGSERGYNTSKLICKNFMQLGLLADIAREVHNKSRDSNVLPLSTTASIIAGLIGTSDTPFLYEKIGSAYHHIIIDEFQDTSQGQWHNFMPLINDSLAENHTSIIVGDVKQSIYRWRNGDWRILGNIGGDNDINRKFGVEKMALVRNWRSSRNIVWFNNAVISQTNSILQDVLAQTLPDSISDSERDKCLAMLGNSYEDICQTPQNLQDSGFVHLEFVDKEEDATAREVILQNLTVLVQSFADKGYCASDIAILVRDKRDAHLVMDALLAHKQQCPQAFNVISQDTLQLKSSVLVRICIALMRVAVGQDDRLNEAFLQHTLHHRREAAYSVSTEATHSPFAGGFDEKEKAFLRSLALCSLPEAFERMVQRYDLHSNTGELPFLQALFDLVIQFSNKKTSDMSAFLQWWEQEGSEKSLSGGGGQDAVMVSTIHKAKGLEYKVVIVPFADWELNTKANSTVWMHCDTAPYNEITELPLAYNKTMGNSFFAEQYAEEKTQAFLDNLNLLYVALTRAKEELYVYVPVGNAAGVSRISNALQKVFENFDAARFAPAEVNSNSVDIFEFGTPVTNVGAGFKPAPTGAIVWDKYFTCGPVPAIRIKVGIGMAM